MAPLLGFGALDLLEADPRPSFVADFTATPRIAYSNPALSGHVTLSDILDNIGEKHSRLWEWVLDGTGSLRYRGVLWTRVLAGQGWIVVGANEQRPEPLAQQPLKNNNLLEPELATPSSSRDHADRPGNLEQLRAKSTPGVLITASQAVNPSPAVEPDPEVLQALQRTASDPGWILPDIMPEQTPFLDVIGSVDWASTPLGPMEAWPHRLQQTFSQILADSRPIALYWGAEYTTIYNEAFSQLCGSRHPSLLGRAVEDAWPEAGQRLREAMATSAQKQRASVEDEWRFFVERADSSPEETYLKWSIIPITEDGQCLGFMHPVLETTSMRLWERRMKMLIDLGDVLVTARDIKSYWHKTLEELEAVDPRYDIPLAILYSVEDSTDQKICRLEGALGVPAGHPIIPQTLTLKTSEEGLSSQFRHAMKVRFPILLQTADGSLPPPLLEGLKWRGFGDPCRAAVVCPIRPTKEENVMGLLFLGLNPRRPYDNDYRQYISLLNQKLTTSLASIVLLEEETRRGRNAAEQAAYDQAMLQEKLAFQTKEATESIQKFEAVAEFVPVGMAFGDAQGHITFANDAWYRITGYPHEGPVASSGFLSCVVDEDKDKVAHAYEQLETARNVTFDFRVKRQYHAQGSPSPSTDSSPGFERAGLDLVVGIENMRTTERHVLATAKAERSASGAVIRILTCLTDVTLHKQTAEEAVRRAQQAENLKRMAELATVGMYDMDMSGRLMGANNVFFEMCGLDKVPDLTRVSVRPWQTCVVDEDMGVLHASLERLVSEGRPQTAEIRFKTPWMAVDGAGNKISAPRWVQATLMPVRSSEGVIQSFTGCLSDVSLQKWQLEREKQRKEEAIESKRQQDSFIDMTSHEMRNPLGAIVHCADAVIATLTKVQQICASRKEEAAARHRSQPLTPPIDRDGAASSMLDLKSDQKGKSQELSHQQLERQAQYDQDEEQLIADSIDNAETIVACAQHQKRIVDDILTMSKLDSKLLAVTPITVDPIQIVKDALKMFEVEARRVDINLSMMVDPSYQKLGVRFLDFDPSRLKQVLINLLTNALKFTVSGPTRNVSVTVAASHERPTDATSSVQFIPRSNLSADEDYDQPALRSGSSGGQHERPIFLLFEVKDTGQGLTEEEKKSLFQRFVQASSRTHVKYGGSGLGLFISRRLTEMQRGAIGVASRPGVGSTFTFYIETFQPSEAALREAEAAAAATARVVATGDAKDLLLINGERGGGHAVKLPASSSSSSSAAAAMPVAAAMQGPAMLDASQVNGILVVEDNLINQQITRRGLVSRGFKVDVANHGVEALDKLMQSDRYRGDDGDGDGDGQETVGGDATKEGGEEEGGPSVKAPFALSMILMDIEMPVQDGLTCTRHIRELERRGRIRGGRIPILAVSANARTEQILECKAAGCDDVLVKPYRMPELIEKMGEVVRRLRGAEAAVSGTGAGTGAGNGNGNGNGNGTGTGERVGT